jgi:4-amino-4-deoxy-L-arabinose transferase-like glycosyltransferase
LTPARERILLAAAFALAAFLFLAGLGRPPLIDPDEGRNAEVAREMREEGLWIVPRYNGFDYLDKPALYFRLVATSFDALGETEFAARLPSAVLGLLTLGILAAFCRRVFGPREAVLAVTVAATAPLVIAFARLVIFDMALAFCTCAALLAGYLAEEREGRARRAWLLAGAAAAGVATLVKGPVGFVVPMLVLAVFHLVERRPRAIARLLHPLNLLVFLAVVLPWFLAVAHAHPDFPRYGIVAETLRRFATGDSDRVKPFWYYVPIVAIGIGAWAILVPRAAVRAWRGRATLSRPDRFLIVWALSTLVFFSLSGSKLPQYVLTTVFALSVLVARVLARAFEDPLGRAADGVRYGLTGIGLMSLGASVVILAFVFWRAPLTRLLDIRSGTFGRAEPVMAPAGVALALIGGVAIAARLTRRVPLHVAAYVAAPLLLATVSWHGLLAFADNSSSREIARGMERVARGVPYACLACYPRGVPFYVRGYPTVFTEDGRELRSNYLLFTLATGRPWPTPIVPFSQRDAWLSANRAPLLLLAQEATRGDLKRIATARGTEVREIAPGWWGALLGGAGG